MKIFLTVKDVLWAEKRGLLDLRSELTLLLLLVILTISCTNKRFLKMTRSSDQPDIVSPTVLMQMALKRTNNAAVTMRPETASRPMPIHTLCRQPVTIATWHTSLSTNCKESGGKALQLRNSCTKQRRNDFCFNLFLHWSRASVVRTQRQFECGCGGNFLSKNDNEIACFVTAARCRLSSYSSFDLRQQYVSFTPDYLQKRRHLLSEHNIPHNPVQRYPAV